MNLRNMPRKHLPNKQKYDFREPNLVNGIPFPRLPKEIFDDVPLKEDYRMYSMDYLDTPEALDFSINHLLELQFVLTAKSEYNLQAGSPTIAAK